MKVGVINLPSRKDRLEAFDWAMRGIDYDIMPSVDEKLALEEGWRADHIWRAGWTGKKTSNKEMACFVSHFQSWGICQRINEPLIILEDDAIPLVQPRFDLYERALKKYDLLYLGYSENLPEKIIKIDEDLIKPRYPYWLSSYAITPRGASMLIKAIAPKNIIPADEFVPLMIGYDHSDSPWRLRSHSDAVQYMAKFEKLNAAALYRPDFIQAGAVVRPGMSFSHDIGVEAPWFSSIATTERLCVCPIRP